MLNFLVGVRGFEPPASSSRTKRASQAALHPEKVGAKIQHFFELHTALVKFLNL